MTSLSLSLGRLKAGIASRQIYKARLIEHRAGKLLVSIGRHIAQIFVTKGARDVIPSGKTKIHVIITHIDERSGLITAAIVSREDDRKTIIAQRLSRVNVGEVYRGRIVNKTSYGLFVSLKGFNGLVHASEVSWNKEASLDNFPVGQFVNVMVLRKNEDKGHVQLSIKATLPNPFELFFKAYKDDPSRAYRGRVANIVDYGLFVLLPEFNCIGLLHVSTLANEGKKLKLLPDEYKEAFQNADLLVQVNDVNEAKSRISLEPAVGIPTLEQLESWPKPGERLRGRVNKMLNDRVEIRFDDAPKGFVYRSMDRDGYLTLAFRHMIGDDLRFEVLSIDFSKPAMNLTLLHEGERIDITRYNFIVANYLAGEAYRDLATNTQIREPYYVLAQHLLHLEFARLDKQFDYIYHFRCIGDVEEIKLFGLVHRASIEFRMGRREFGYALLASALRDAIRLRRARTVRLALAIFRKYKEDLTFLE